MNTFTSVDDHILQEIIARAPPDSCSWTTVCLLVGREKTRAGELVGQVTVSTPI